MNLVVSYVISCHLLVIPLCKYQLHLFLVRDHFQDTIIELKFSYWCIYSCFFLTFKTLVFISNWSNLNQNAVQFQQWLNFLKNQCKLFDVVLRSSLYIMCSDAGSLQKILLLLELLESLFMVPVRQCSSLIWFVT